MNTANKSIFPLITVCGLVWATGCADPCADDGLLQEDQSGNCPAFGETDSDSGESDTTSTTSTTEASTSTTSDGTDSAGGSCSDGMQNGDETDVDCGGSACEPCGPSQGCEEDMDCASGVCTDGLCAVPTCSDGVANGNETDVDCGAECGSTCQPTDTCGVFVDCEQLVCTQDQCADPTCSDGAPNGNETDVDCGGPDCDPCSVPGQCLVGTDCISGVCDQGQCVGPQCADGTQNGNETDVDCGGPDCAPCDDGDSCVGGPDCLSEVCENSICTAASCTDGIQNGSETGVDCGGDQCPACPNGGGCTQDSDCESGQCDEPSGTCEDPTCSDGMQNGDETDVDCGGGSCVPCDDGDMCIDDTDCASQMCSEGTCESPTCDDGVQNGLESDVDCGGGECPACDVGDDCLLASDCVSMVCLNETCQPPPACDDGIQNGGETDVDCGGRCGATCEPGEGCAVDGDCLSAGCDEQTLTCNDYLSVTVAPECSAAAGGSVTLTATASGGTGGPYTYAWTPDDGTVVSPTEAITDVNPPDGFTSYMVTVDDGANQANASAVVIDSDPFDLENNCTLFTADYDAGSTGELATITYTNDGTVACETGNNELGLHLCTGVTFTETQLAGQVGVSDADGDNDWVGLIWGAQDESNFYSLVWKESAQDFFGCTTPAGILVKRIEADEFTDLGGADFYCPNDTAQSTVLAAPADATTAGWEEGETYTITIDYQATQSAILVERDSDGAQIASFTITDSTFPSGFFGSTTLSQANACVGPLLAQCL